ncbi:hypothetical protein [Paenarthrobacter ureafaciens]|uniref:hypothetical protein n=1 Tax=Paenarthrobacter ureafaciens TaxID=37931 RepID=UPI001916E42E|nr:hypothetical protein [Paenarthrobacter ureafaciens]QQQ63232.1 hypothetical protein JHQ56_05270 [Paenarthrobacter ureafaciens]
MGSAANEWHKVGPAQARKFAKVYASLGDRTPTQRRSATVSMGYTLTVASLAGLVVRRGPVTAIAGTERDFQRLARLRYTLVAATGLTFVILVDTIVPAALRFGLFAAAELLLLGMLVAILPSRKFHRARGVLPKVSAWKRRFGVKDVWMLYALIHEPELPADELGEALRSLTPDLVAGSAALVCTTSESQVTTLQGIGFIRDSDNIGILYRKASALRSAGDGMAAEPA